MRQNDLAWEVRDYLNAHPRAAVINLGCGLDNTGRACDNGRCSIWNIDLPDVIELRDRLLPPGEREKNLAFDLKTRAGWMLSAQILGWDGAVCRRGLLLLHDGRGQSSGHRHRKTVPKRAAGL